MIMKAYAGTVRNSLRLAGVWLSAFSPLIVVAGGGGSLYWQAVVDSIMSTPHPMLVAMIGIVALASSVMFGFALHSYDQELVLAQKLGKLDEDAARKYLALHGKKSLLLQTYLVAYDEREMPSLERQERVEGELLVAEGKIFGKLTLANYLGGSMVGLGLVGTFIGLLAALADLGHLFTSMTKMTSGGSGGDSSAMFSEMLLNLQAPMKGMGTAFVASLYGLLGSLVLGLVGLFVKRYADKALVVIRHTLRDLDERAAEKAPSPMLSSGANGPLPVEFQDVLDFLISRLGATSNAPLAGAGSSVLKPQDISSMRSALSAIEHNTAQSQIELRDVRADSERNHETMRRLFVRLRLIEIRSLLGNSPILSGAAIAGMILLASAQLYTMHYIPQANERFRELEVEHNRDLTQMASENKALTVEVRDLNEELGAFARFASMQAEKEVGGRLRQMAADNNANLISLDRVNRQALANFAASAARLPNTDDDKNGLAQFTSQRNKAFAALSLAQRNLSQDIILMNTQIGASSPRTVVHALTELNDSYRDLLSNQNRQLAWMAEQCKQTLSQLQGAPRGQVATDKIALLGALHNARDRLIQLERSQASGLAGMVIASQGLARKVRDRTASPPVGP